MKRLMYALAVCSLFASMNVGTLNAEDDPSVMVRPKENTPPHERSDGYILLDADVQSAHPLFQLLVEPLSAEWEARLVPPLLHSLLRLAPFTTLRVEPELGLRAVAVAPGRLALVHRSSALDLGAAELGLELLEVGPASCMLLAVRQDALWNGFSDLNYGSTQPLRVEAVSPAAKRKFERILETFPLATDVALTVRPTHIAVQRLISSDSDVLVIDAPRLGVSGEMADVVAFVKEKKLRLLPVPMYLFKHHDRLSPGHVVIDRAWFWQNPQVYETVCDPFVLAMPREGADELIYALYNALADVNVNDRIETKVVSADNGNGNGGKGESFFDKFLDASRSFLVMIGLLR
ncbi:hypothetical protein SAMN05660653_02462 [Desulfonatronum thiosulfatophilum]|uniref:Uncharacterized protein n=1 Tax=Desulfonatronum thiosulfatophilum TaxID=617002 RepID=A0A1G6DXZ2_9BACT|nr:hypothetical protein [Desulfonatronum thiosulfatophilum]SDB49998.1 hypothetical protein SAMN05660653_02462 [Desulfonatronum thiosulfatophilum]